MKRQSLYVVAWASGHQPPRVVYFRASGKGWGGTYEREQATRFKSARKARETYDSKHAFPEEYAHCWESGAWRVEPERAPMLPFCQANEQEENREEI